MSKTKEEILNKIANENSYEDCGEYMYDAHTHTQVEAACAAMDEYAAQESEKKAVAFAEWKQYHTEYTFRDVCDYYIILHINDNKTYSLPDLYQYWIENVYNK